MVKVTPDTAIYTAGDVIGGALTFPLSISSTGGGLINSLMVADNGNIGAAGSLWLFRQDLATPIADQAPFAVAFADFANLITILTLPSFNTISAMKVAVLTDINDQFYVTGDKLIGYFVTSVTPTFAAARSLQFRLGLLTQ
jgi:hypothetical protein